MEEKSSRGVAQATPLPDPPMKLPIIRITVSARVAYDLDSMTKITANMMKELGCEPCHSGYDIRFELASQYAVTRN